MLASYLLNAKLGAAALPRLIRGDISRFKDLGASSYAADLSEVLKRLEFPLPEMVTQCRGGPRALPREIDCDDMPE